MRHIAASVARGITSLARSATRVAVSLVYPPACVCCRAEMEEPDDGLLLCQACRATLIGQPHTTCLRCAATVDAPANMPQPQCTRCRGLTFHFREVVALGSYRGELREAVLRTKHASGEAVAGALARLLAERQHERIGSWQPRLVVPAPMHWRRRLVRGANGPEVMAAAIAGRFSKARFARSLVRTRFTARQTDVPAEERAANVRGAFEASLSKRLSGASVLVVDDIFTTGSTANEAARALLEAGAAEVYVAVIARAESPEAHFS